MVCIVSCQSCPRYRRFLVAPPSQRSVPIPVPEGYRSSGSETWAIPQRPKDCSWAACRRGGIRLTGVLESTQYSKTLVLLLPLMYLVNRRPGQLTVLYARTISPPEEIHYGAELLRCRPPGHRSMGYFMGTLASLN